MRSVCLVCPDSLGRERARGHSLTLDKLQTQTRDLTIKHRCLITFIHFVLE